MKKHTKKETENVEVLETPVEETEVIEEEATEKKFSVKKALPWIVGGVAALVGGALVTFGKHNTEELYPVDDSYDYGSDEDDEASTDEDPDGDAPSEDSEE